MRKVCRTNFVAVKRFILTKPLPTSEKLSREKVAKSAKRAEALQIISREKGLVQKERPKNLVLKERCLEGFSVLYFYSF